MPLWDRPKLLCAVFEQGTSKAFTFQNSLLPMKSENSTFDAPDTHKQSEKCQNFGQRWVKFAFYPKSVRHLLRNSMKSRRVHRVRGPQAE